jgi:hypothetical protein
VGVEALGLVIFGVDQEHPDIDRLRGGSTAKGCAKVWELEEILADF